MTMTLTRRPPDRPTVPLRTALERLMGDWPLAQFDARLTELGPPLDVRETDDAYIVEIDLPGVDPKDTEVLIEGRTLTVRGQFSDEKVEERGNYLVRERRQGQFMRAVALPGMVEIDQIRSHAENGRLTIKLPKATQNRARRIEIDAGSGNGRQSSARQPGDRQVTSSQPTSKASGSGTTASSQTSTRHTAPPSKSPTPPAGGFCQQPHAGRVPGFCRGRDRRPGWPVGPSRAASRDPLGPICSWSR
jgi:HSP20 family protein